MTQKTSFSLLRKGAIVLAFFLLVVMGLLFSSFRMANKMADDVWKVFGITKQTGDEKIKNSFINGYLYYYGVKNLKSIAQGDRETVAKNLLTYTKEYVSSPVFIKEYEAMRKSAQPQEPVSKKLRSIEEIQKDEIAKTEKSIKDSEKTMKELPDLAKSLQPLMDMLKKNLKDYQDPKNTYFANIALGEKYDQENQIKSHKERTKQWEVTYPENVNLFVAERLQRMLDATKDIDYSAELKEDKYGKKKFVNSKYEYKNGDWKMGFRAGKEVTETSRAFVQKWLSELNVKK
jgi:hypothetical protein